MFVAFGATFEVPIVVVLLHRMGVVSLAQLKSARPYVVVVRLSWRRLSLRRMCCRKS